MIDFHSHLMPGVDDGAADIDESRSGLEVMRGQGITTIITTPHIRASLTDRPAELEHYLADLDRAFDSLATLAATEFPDIRVERGVELMLDTPQPAMGDLRLHLAGTSFVLMEFPYMTIPPNSAMAVRQLRGRGVIPIVAHPERYSNMSSNMELIESWRDAGAYIQVNAGSFVGQYGNTARRLVWTIIEQGWADYLSSDYHSRGRCSVRACSAAMLERGGASQLRAMTVTNPQRMLRSEAPLPVEPLEEVQLGFWRKVFR
ncbi:MAG TPA: CpsB/CapC family capsule biosynthesis tyrosine phosphatase [Gemmatimonadaceae bacterium]|nr:CpsB/CapC family capsule biosynthesis tyrosine phosphatase [Gemmatimonadaceae bacterium]